MNADDFLDAPSADDFLGESPASRPLDPRRQPMGRGFARRPAPAPVSVLQTESFEQAPEPAENARALFTALTSNPDLVNSPMYQAGAAILARGNEPSAVVTATRRNRENRAIAADRARMVQQARENTDAAFGDNPVVQAIAAPGRRLASGVASVVGGVAGVPQLFGSDLGRDAAGAMRLMSQAHMPEDPGIADEIMAGLGQVAPMVGGATLVRAGLAPLFGEAAATGAATSLTGAAGGALSGSEVLRDLEGRTDLTPEEKQGRALFAALVSGASGKVADRFLLPGADKLAAGPLQAAGRAFMAEGAQEGLDQVTQNFSTDKALSEGVGRAALVGGVVGGGTRAVGEVGSDANQLANALNADAQALADAPTPQVIQQPVARIVGTPLPAPAPVARPAPAPIPALPYDPSVKSGDPDIMVAGQDGNVRPMTADEFLQAEDVKQQGQDSGLTPDVQRAQDVRAQGNRAEPTVQTPALVRQLMERGWKPPENTDASQAPAVDPARAPGGAAVEGATAGAGGVRAAGDSPGLTNPALNNEPSQAAQAARDQAAAPARGDALGAAAAATAAGPAADVEAAGNPALNDAIGKDLEQIYQAEVKDSIRQRLGIAKPAKEAAEPRNAGFVRFLRENGISSELASDIYGDHAGKANRALPGVFRKNGMQLDDLVARAVERGFLTQADVESALDNDGTNKLVELIQGQIRGKAPISTEMAGDVAQQQAARRVSTELERQAEAIGFDTTGLSDDQVNAALRRIERRRDVAKATRETYDAAKEARLERQAVLDADTLSDQEADNMEAAWSGGSNVDLASAMRALGFDETEINDAVSRETEEAGRGQAAAGDAAGRGPRADQADQASEGRPEGLESYTPDEVVQRQDQAAQADKDEQRQQAADEARDRREREQREIGDRTRQDASAENYQLGQDADDALAGQGGLFSRGTDEDTSTADSIRSELRERFGDIIDRLEKRGFLKLWDSTDDYNRSAGQSSQQLEGAVQGMYARGVAHLFGNGIEPGKAVAVFLHEVGEHASMKKMLGGERYRDLVRRAYRLASDGDEIAEIAMMRIPDDTPAKFQDSEMLAYLIEEAAGRDNASPGLRKWLADVVAAVRAWFFQSEFGKKLEGYGIRIELTPKDIAALAERAVQWQAKQGEETAPEPAAGGMAVDIALSRKSAPTAAQAAAATFGNQPANPNTVASAAQPWTVAEPGTWDNVVRTIQNSKIDLKRVRAAIEERFGLIPEQTDAYLQEELYHGRVAARVEKLHAEAVEPILRKIAVSGVTLDEVNSYLHARHAPERNAAMKAINPGMANNDALSGMSDTDAARILGSFGAKTQALQGIARDIDQLLADTRTNLVADGLEDAGVVQAWEQAYTHYVPLMRDPGDKPAKGSGFSVRGPEAKRAMGSNKAAVNILANIVTQAETAAIRAEKAEVGRSLLAMAKQYPNPDFWKVDTPPTKPRIDPKTGLVERSAVDPMYQTADNVVMVKEYGATRFIVFNKDNERAAEMAKAMKNLDIQQVPKLVEYIGKATRFMASLLTQRNPEFWFTNFARDLQGSAIQMNGTDAEGLQKKVLANLPKAMAGMRHVARETGKSTQWAKYAQELKDAGGTTGYMQMFENSDARMKDLQREVDRMQQGKADPRKLVRQLIDFIDDYNDVVENGMRLAVFQAARDSGVSTQRAASIAKNITVNFNRKGNATPFVNSLYMFFNAGIQGTARLAQALASSNKARIAVGGLAGAAFIMDMVNRELAGEDDETKRNRYDLIPEFEKSRNWIIMGPDGKYVKVPLPLGFHVFHNAGRLMSDAMGRKDPRNASEYGWAFASTLIDAFSPVGSVASVGQLIAPSVADPVVQLAENKSFTGGPVYRSDDKGFGKTDPKPAYTRHFDSTPDFWKAASRTLNDITGGDKDKRGLVNVEPDILRHVWSALTGGPGRALDRTVDATQATVRGEEVAASRLPFASRFYGVNDDRQKDRAYYEDLHRAARAKEDYDHFMKVGRRDLALEVVKELGAGDPARGRKVIAEFERSKKDGRAINKRLRQLREDDTNDSAQTEQLAALKKRRQQRYRQALGNTAAEE